MKLISNQINPHFNLRDSLHAVGSLWTGVEEAWLNVFFEQKFLPAARRGSTKNYMLTNTARTALGVIADVVQLDKQKRIGLPAFICAVVATPFLSRGYQIEWLDTDENGVLDVDDFKQKAAGLSLVVVPHIFGQVAPLEKIMSVAKEHDVFVVEDGAHHIRQLEALTKVETDAQILSFGREKVVSCVAGGALLWPDNSPHAKAFQAAGASLSEPSNKWTYQHALQPLWFSLALPWWRMGGKMIPWLVRKLKQLPLAVTSAEKSGEEDIPMAKLGLPQQRILARQLELHAAREAHAKKVANAWQQRLAKVTVGAEVIVPPTAFRVLLAKVPDSFKTRVNQLPGLHARDWDGVPISPSGVDLAKFGYTPGQCPRAENFARTHITLPTNIRTKVKDVERWGSALLGKR